jgi:hypothetical protein
VDWLLGLLIFLLPLDLRLRLLGVCVLGVRGVLCRGLGLLGFGVCDLCL